MNIWLAGAAVLLAILGSFQLLNPYVLLFCVFLIGVGTLVGSYNCQKDKGNGITHETDHQEIIHSSLPERGSGS
jgi:hypothetical protein